jgi:hypothetical protein
MHFSQFIIVIASAILCVAPPVVNPKYTAVQLTKNLQQRILADAEISGKNILIPDTLSIIKIVCPETNDTSRLDLIEADSITRNVLSKNYLIYSVIISSSEFTLSLRPFEGKTFRDQNLDDFKMIQSEGKSSLEYPYKYQSGFTWIFHFKEKEGKMVLISIARAESC